MEWEGIRQELTQAAPFPGHTMHTCTGTNLPMRSFNRMRAPFRGATAVLMTTRPDDSVTDATTTMALMMEDRFHPTYYTLAQPIHTGTHSMPLTT